MQLLKINRSPLHHFTICCVSNCGNQDPLHLEHTNSWEFSDAETSRKTLEKKELDLKKLKRCDCGICGAER